MCGISNQGMTRQREVDLNGFLIFLALNTGTGNGSDVYVYPERIKLETTCALAPEKIAAVESQWSHRESGAAGIARAIPADLNRDGKCEIFLDNPSDDEGNGNEFWTLLIERDGAYVPSGDIFSPPESCWYGEFSNGYARIFVPTNVGLKVNPEYVTQVFAFDGEKYAIESGTTFTHGAYLDMGLKAYRGGNFGLAERYYLDAYRMHRLPEISDANNLALTWLKLGKIREAKGLLESTLEDRDPSSQVAAAHFNLGLIEQQLGDLDAALRHYERANDIEPTAARRDKVDTVRKLRQSGKAAR
jgi:hypothetical protein